MASVGSITTSTYYQGVRTQEEKSKMGKDDFLKILVTQLSHQDPLQPLQDREFIAQMAQFSNLEQMVNLNKSFTDFTQTQMGINSYAPMIGKEVSWLDPDTQMDQTGTVTGVTMKEGAIRYMVGNQEVPVEQAYAVRSEQK